MSATGLYMRGSGREVTDWDLIRAHIFCRDEWTCYVCGQPASQVDHVWPRRHGGTDHVDNLKAICPKCNQRKGDRVDMSAASGDDLQTAVDAGIARVETELKSMDRFLEAIAQKPDSTWELHLAMTALLVLDAAIRSRVNALRVERESRQPDPATVAAGDAPESA